MKKMSAREISRSLSIALFLSLGITGLIAPQKAAAEPKAISAELAPLLEKGYNQMKEGKYSAAVKTLTEAVKLDGDSITARRYLAFALVRDGQPLNSIKQMNLIVKQIKPTYFEWCTFGEAYLAAGAVSQAQNCYEQALKVAPTSSYARSGLIRANVKSGNYSEALGIAEEGMKGSRDNNSYDYFKKLYAGVRSHMLASGSGGAAPMPVAENDAASDEPLDKAALLAQQQAQRQSRAEEQKRKDEILRRITSSQGKVINHPGG
ncbi:tetratricopeptide repeat protein [bacterium]|nr:tetratricopeptide repeat protein [bacterium]